MNRIPLLLIKSMSYACLALSWSLSTSATGADESYVPATVELTDNLLSGLQRAQADPSIAPLMLHFPVDTTSARWLRYWPAFLQGGAGIHIEYDHENVAAVWQQHLDQFQYHHQGPINGWVQYTKTISKPTDAEPLPINYRNPDDESFSSDWRIGVFVAKPTNPTANFIWNHGSMNGIAVNEKTGRIIYFAERW